MTKFKTLEDIQHKNRFDRVTAIKIAKGAGIAATGAIALYVLKFLGTINFGTLTPLVATLTPILINAIHEYMKGED